MRSRYNRPTPTQDEKIRPAPSTVPLPVELMLHFTAAPGIAPATATASNLSWPENRMENRNLELEDYCNAQIVFVQLG